MTVHDKDGIMHILRQTPEFKPEEVTVAEEVIDSYLGNPGQSGYYILVAQIDGEVKGYICYGPTPMTTGTWDIYWMAITRQEQGKGIGGALMKAGENEI
jgi:GNAT superfamily N-acetyltransferase